MKFLILTSSILLFLFGCTMYNSCRPMANGMIYFEKERVNINLEIGNYEKRCIYYDVLSEASYQYNCEWSKQ